MKQTKRLPKEPIGAIGANGGRDNTVQMSDVLY